MSQNIFNGYAQYKERLKPAVLSEGVERGKVNSQIIGAWLVQNQINVNTLETPEAVADALYRATVANFPKLLWDVKPKALLKLIENEKKQNKTTAWHEQEQFAEKMKAADAAKAQTKADDAAKKQIENVIGGFVLTGGSGAIAHGKTAIYQTKLRARVSRLQKFGTSWTDIAFDIADTARKVYDAQEKANERTGIQDSLEDVLAKMGVQV